MKKVMTILMGVVMLFSLFFTGKVSAVTIPRLYVNVSGKEVMFTWANDGADASAVYIAKKNTFGRYVLVYDGDEEMIDGQGFSCILDVGEYRANMRSWKSGVPSDYSSLVYFSVDNQNTDLKYYPRYSGSSNSIVDALDSIGIDRSYGHREKIAIANSINDYRGSAAQNVHMLNLLKEGKLINPDAINMDSSININDGIDTDIENKVEIPDVDATVDERYDWRARLKLKYYKENIIIYWNHNGLPYNTMEEKAIANAGYTTERCYCSDHAHYYNVIKECTCNWYNGGSQCVGFALYIFNDIWGVNPDLNAMSTFTNMNVLKPGDLLKFQYTNDPDAEYKWHYAIVLEVGEGNVSVLESNYGDNCIIKYGNIHYMDEMTRYSTPFYYSVQ